MLENDFNLKRLLNVYMDYSNRSFQVKEIIADMEFHETELTSKETIEIYLMIVEEIKKYFTMNYKNPLIKNGFIVRNNFQSENLEKCEIIVTFEPIKNLNLKGE